jgi:hypothetical protein
MPGSFLIFKTPRVRIAVKETNSSLVFKKYLAPWRLRSLNGDLAASFGTLAA